MKTVPLKVAPIKTAPIKTAPIKAAAGAVAGKTLPKATASLPVVVNPAAPAKAAPPKPAAKSITTTTRKSRGDSGSEANLHKRVDSERIALHIAAFEKLGGRVEKLGVTRVLQKVTEAASAAPAQAAKSGSRRR